VRGVLQLAFVQPVGLPAPERYEQAQALHTTQAAEQERPRESAQQIPGTDGPSHDGPRMQH